MHRLLHTHRDMRCLKLCNGPRGEERLDNKGHSRAEGEQRDSDRVWPDGIVMALGSVGTRQSCGLPVSGQEAMC